MSYTLRDPSLNREFGFSQKVISAPKAATFSNGCHVCEVEIDPDTGVCKVITAIVVDDVGRVLVLDAGQGSRCMAVWCRASARSCSRTSPMRGRPTSSGSFMDYAMPRAAYFLSSSARRTKC